MPSRFNQYNIFIRAYKPLVTEGIDGPELQNSSCSVRSSTELASDYNYTARPVYNSFPPKNHFQHFFKVNTALHTLELNKHLTRC